MPTYQVTAPDGRKVRLTGDAPPSDADLDEIFAGLPPPKTAEPSKPVVDGMLMPMVPLTIGPDGRPQVSQDMSGPEAVARNAYATAATMAGPIALGGLGASALGAGAVGGAIDYAITRNPVSAAKAALEAAAYTKGAGYLAKGAGVLAKYIPGMSRSLTARLIHSIGQATTAAAEEAPIVAAADTPVARLAARYVAGEAPITPAITQAAQTAKVSAPMAAGAAPAAEAESELAAQLRQSIEQAKARKMGAASAPRAGTIPPAATPGSIGTGPKMALEVERKVLNLKQTQGLSNAQVAASLKAAYGIPESYAAKMVDMILQTHGLK